jgi:FKBP-type peptidyl-prolyl cis-trans isomerase SlyD
VIKNGNRVSIEYTLKLNDGSVAESNVGRDPLTYEHGKGEILPVLESSLEDLDVAQSKTVTLSPEQGYGPVQSELFQSVDSNVVPEEAQHRGARLVVTDAGGTERQIRVHEVRAEEIVLDLNHPLAGQHLHFDVKVLAIE